MRRPATRTERDALRRTEARLAGWTSEARDRERTRWPFGGPDAAVTDEARRPLDRVDVDPTRRGEGGPWGVDEYGVSTESGTGRRLHGWSARTTHEGVRGRGSLDEATRAELDDPPWDSPERVTDRPQSELGALLRDEREA